MILLFSCFLLAINAILDIIEVDKKRKNIFLGLSTLTLFLLYALSKATIFTDNRNYIPYYETLNNWNFNDIFEYEVGWGGSNKIISLISGGNFRILTIIVGFFITYSYAINSKKLSPFPALSIFLFLSLGFWGMSGTVLRQGVAMAISMFSLKYIVERKPVKYYMLACLAILFHYSSILLLILYPLSKFKFSKTYFTLAAVLFIAACFLGDQGIILVNELFGKEYIVSFGANFLLIGLIITMTLLEIFAVQKWFKYDNKMNLFCHMSMVASFLTVMSIHNYSFIRLSYYFLISQIFLLPGLLTKLDKKHQLLFGSVIIIGGIIFYTLIIDFNSGAMTSYQFFWN